MKLTYVGAVRAVACISAQQIFTRLQTYYKYYLLTRSLQFQTNPYTAMRAEGGAAGGGGGGAGGGGDWGVGAGAGTLPPSAGYYSYDHPSLTAYRYCTLCPPPAASNHGLRLI